MELPGGTAGNTIIGGILVAMILVFARKKMRKRMVNPKIIPGVTPRQLGDIEVLASWRNEFTDGLMSNAFHVVSKEKLTFVTVKAAFTLVANKQACLRSRICSLEDEGELWYLPLDEDVEYDIKEKPRKEWEQEVEEQMLMKYNERTGPLWRVVFLPNASHGKASGDFHHESVIVLGCHHAIIDGVSLMRLIAQVTTVINKLLSGESLTDLQIYDLEPPIEKVVHRKGIKESVIWDFVQGTSWLISCLPTWVFTRFMRVGDGGNPFYESYGLPVNIVKTVPAKTAIIPLDLGPEMAKTLLQACRQNNATIQGAAVAAVNVAMEKVLMSGSDTCEVTYITRVMTNARHFLNVTIPQNAMGYYSSVIDLPTVLTKNQQAAFWQNAKQFSKTIKCLVTREQAVKTSTIIYLVSKFIQKNKSWVRKTMQENGNLKGDATMNVFSNIGNCKFINNHATNMKVTGRHGAVSGNIMATSPFRHYIATVDGYLCWTLVYSLRYVSTENAARVGAAILDALKTALQ